VSAKCRLCGETSGLFDAGEHGEYRICGPCWDIVAFVAKRATTLQADPLRLLNLSEAAERMGISRSGIAKWKREVGLPIIDIAGRPFVREVDLIDWLASFEVRRDDD